MTKAAWIRLALLAAAIGGLEGACRAGWLPRTAIIPPTEMAAGGWRAVASGELNEDMAQTFSVVAIAIVVSLAGGFLVGFAIHGRPRLRRALDPFLGAYYAIPHFAFYPLLIVLFGLGPGPLIALAVMFGVVAMIVATMNGLDRVPRVLGKTAQVMRLTGTDELWRVRLPAALPHLFAGVKLAIAYSFIGVIAGEFILSTKGIGHAIAFAYDNFDARSMYGLILFVLLLVASVNLTLHTVEQRLIQRRSR